MLKAPLAVGTQWQAGTTACLLKRRQAFARENRHTHPSVNMNYALEAVGLKAGTRVGTFDECLRVKGVGRVRLMREEPGGTMTMELTEWK